MVVSREMAKPERERERERGGEKRGLRESRGVAGVSIHLL